MTHKDCRFWKKDDVAIVRAPGPLDERQKIRAEKILLVAGNLVKIKTPKKSR